MCADVVDVEGRLYFRDVFLRVARSDVASWTSLGPIEASFRCDDTGAPAVGSTRAEGIAAYGAPIGASVYAVPTEPGVLIVDSAPEPLLYRLQRAGRLDFNSRVIEISINTPELIDGSSAPTQRLSTITDLAAIDELISEALSADRLTSSATDIRYEFVVELLRDDGLVTALALDPHANVLDDRVLGPIWAAATATLTVTP
jgi:hypothetical protein